MSIIYSISIILLFIVIILIKKTEQKLDIIKTLIMTSTLLLAYNTLVCYILNLINIPINLLGLSIINFIVAIFVLINIIKRKDIQKYTMSKTNIIVTILFIIIVAIVTNINFDGLNRIRYVSMDAREHYKAAREFSENTALSSKAPENNTMATTFMPMGYANVGILFKILNPYMGTVELYKIYILFEAFIYLLTALMFYMIIEKYCKDINKKIIAIIFCIIYMLGYPLNAWISGFHYLVIGILYIETILYYIMKDNKLELNYDLIIMFLLNFGLILSYALFCPFVYLAEFIYFVYKFKKDRIKLFLLILTTLVLPGIIGVSYLIIPTLGRVGDCIALEGWLYKNIWSNFILFIPFAIYYIYTNIKNRKVTFDNIILLTLLVYMVILFIGTKTGKCSEYYFYKNYFILWTMIIYSNIRGILEFAETVNKKYITNIYSIIYLIIFVISICNTRTYVMQNPNDSINEMMQIFTFNKTMIISKESAFVKSDELQLLKEMEKRVEDKWQNDESILFITEPTQERWIQSLTGYKNILFDDKEYAVQNLKDEKYKYIVTFENRNVYKQIEKYINKENMKIIYEDENGKIYEKEH